MTPEQFLLIVLILDGALLITGSVAYLAYWLIRPFTPIGKLDRDIEQMNRARRAKYIVKSRQTRRGSIRD